MIANNRQKRTGRVDFSQNLLNKRSSVHVFALVFEINFPECGYFLHNKESGTGFICVTFGYASV